MAHTHTAAYIVFEISTASSEFRSRSAHAIRAGAIHFILSSVVAIAIAALVFGLWFRSPLSELVGGVTLFLLIICVDVVCGPLLTLVVFNPEKPRSELRRDLVIVAVIQLLALGYGLHTLAYARPVALVYEVDRFRVVTYSDLDEAEAAKVPDWARPWSLTRPRTMGLRQVTTSAEKLASIDASLQGIEPSQRPSWWQNYSMSNAQVLERAHLLSELRDKHTNQAKTIDEAVAEALANKTSGETMDGAALLWLPLVSRLHMDWVVLLDPVTARVRGYAHLDGF